MQFHEKLSILMNVFKLNNSSLARGINIDASLVSRWKTGERRIAVNSPHIPALATFFLKINAYPYQKEYLDRLIKTHMTPPMTDQEADRIHVLANWFISPNQTNMPMLSDDPEKLDPSANLISDIAGFLHDQPNLTDCPPTADLADKAAVPSGWRQAIIPGQELYCEVFSGLNGKRQAVINFLSQALQTDEPCEILLTSDESIEWLAGDPSFTLVWADLMLQNIRKGHRITVIHVVNRRPSEIVGILNYWLPLHMAGPIQSFYYPRYSSRTMGLSLFVLRRQAVILAQSAGGQTAAGQTFLFSDHDTVEHYTRIFLAYLRQCRPLLAVFNDQTNQDLLVEKRAMAARSGTIYHLRHQLNEVFLPSGSLRQIIARAEDADDPEQIEKSLTAGRAIYQAWPETRPDSRKIIDLLPLRLLDDIRRHHMMFQVDCDLHLRSPVPLTETETIIWLRCTIEALRRNDQYQVYFYQETAEMDQDPINILFQEGQAAFFSRADHKGRRPMVIMMSEANVLYSLGAYFDEFIEKIPVNQRSRGDVIQKLDKLIQELQHPLDSNIKPRTTRRKE